MFNVYNKIDETEFEFGQDARTKEWYCKSFKSKTIKEADRKMGDANKLCNKYNSKKEKVSPVPPQKEKNKVRM